MRWPSFFRLLKYGSSTRAALVNWLTSVPAAIIVPIRAATSAPARAMSSSARPTARRWSLPTAIIVPILAVIAGLVVDLLVTRGELQVPVNEVAAHTWVGEPDSVAGGEAHFSRRGLLPFAWRQRDAAIVGGLFPWLYQNWPALQTNESCLLTLICCSIVLAGALTALMILKNRSSQTVALDAGNRIREKIHRHAFRLGPLPPGRGSRGVAEQLFTGRVVEVRTAMAHWWDSVPYAVLMLFLLLFSALLIHAWITLAAVLVVVVAWLIYRALAQRARARAAIWSDRADLQQQRMIDQLRQVQLVTSYNMDEAPGVSLTEEMALYRDAAARGMRASAAVNPLVMFISIAGGGFVAFLLGVNILRPDPGISLGAMTMLTVALTAAFFRVRRLSLLGMHLEKVEPAAKAILQYLDRQPVVDIEGHSVPLEPVENEIAFRSVTLADQKGTKLLDRMSLVIPAGRRVAFVSSDRAATRAMTGLLLRYFDPAAGSVTFDDLDLRRAAVESIHQQVALVSADGMLFSGTVRDNLQCGRNGFSDQQIHTASRVAGAEAFVSQLVDNYDTTIGDEGVQLTPLAAFHFGLARAVLGGPSVLLVHEPDLEIDDATSAAIDRALATAGQGRTTIFLQPRISSLRLADQIFLIHEGKIAAQGKHNDLLQQSELYRHISYTRFNPYRQKVK